MKSVDENGLRVDSIPIVHHIMIMLGCFAGMCLHAEPLPRALDSVSTASAIDPAKVAIIKADDFRGPNQAWTDFMQASRDIGVKVGLGVIVEHIDGNNATYDWMQGQDDQGDVEFWNHGWDHSRIKDADGNTVSSEFDGSGLAFMCEHMQLAQAGLRAALGRNAVTFGTPYNAFDADTATVINETSALRLLFSRYESAESLLDNRVSVVDIISELDGTGKPNAAKFKERFTSGPVGPVSLQFHPTAFDATGLGEYTEIVQYLQSKGYTIMLPSEYVAALDAQKDTGTSPAVIFDPLFSMDFEDDTVGNIPESGTSLESAGGTVRVIDGATNKAGIGNGVRLTDTGDPDYVRMGYTFTSEAGESAVRIDMDIARLSNGTSGSPFIVGLYNSGGMSGSYHDRYASVFIYGNGDIQYGDSMETAALDLNTSYTLSIYANDGDTAIFNYRGPHDLEPDTVDFWMDGVYKYSIALRTDTAYGLDPTNTSDALGMLGILSLSSATPGSIAVDNIEVSSIELAEFHNLLDESFESYAAGDVPEATRIYAVGDANNFMSVVGDDVNTAGTGNGLQIKDDSSDGTGLEYEFGSYSAVKVSFDFSPLELVPEANASFYFGIGQAGVALTSHTRRFAQFEMRNDGTLQVVFDGNSFALDPITVGSSNNLTVYANDYDARSVSYTEGGSSYMLPPNSVAWWVNGVLQLNGSAGYGSLDVDEVTAGGTVGTSEGNLARIGINTLSSHDSLNSAFDNFSVYGLTPRPEPVRLHNLFMDHMVLQRDMDVPVWGTGSPGAAVDLLLDDVPAGSTTVDEQGDWMVRLSPRAHDGGVSHELKVQVSNQVQQVISDIVFGDVYLCSGQSNMEFVMSSELDFDAVFSSEENQYIRHIAIQRGYSDAPLDEPVIEQVWQTTEPATIGNFTAVGYMFAREIYDRTGVPVGLLNSSYGGRPIHRYLNFQGLEQVPELAGYLAYAEDGGITGVASVYNAQIAPLLPFGICGFLWYQGETDRANPGMYAEKMRALVRGWRSAWAYGELPFYYCQLPHWDNNYFFRLIRDAQLRALSETNCGMAVTIDVGDDNDIHPKNKQDPGRRLAQWALAKQYGFANVYSGPVVFKTMQEGARIRVLFDYAEGGLMVGRKPGADPVEAVPGGPLECFEVAGSDRVFVAADAVIDADTVLVSAPSVSSPQYVRYCYSEASNGSNRLYNAAGLPAAAFRSDSSCGLTVASGTGSADSVLPGTVLNLVADSPPAGQIFDRWIGGADAIADANSSSTTITMPERDLYIAASYRDGDATTQTLTVDCGGGGAAAEAESIIEITAATAPPGQVFDRWVGDTQTVVNVSSAFTTLRMPESNTTLTATYRAEDPPSIQIPVIDGIDLSADQCSLLLPTTDTGVRYELQSCGKLVGSTWRTAVYNVKGDGGNKKLVFATQGTSEEFYRLKAQ